MEKLDAVVVGAGVVGLAAARALALAGRDVVLLESTADIGSGISSRNSEVIHAGLYYPPGSLKARLCIEGRDRLYQYCASRKIPHRQTGKLIVAVGAEQLPALLALQQSAHALGAGELPLLNQQDVAAKEPALTCAAALHSPRSGIIDSHALMLSLLGDMEAEGGWLARNTPLLAARPSDDGGFILQTGGSDPMVFSVRLLVLCTGLETQALAQKITGLNPASVPRLHLAKGTYFSLRGPSPFRHLIYPLPEPGLAGLGTHVTLDMAGQARFGPDVEWVETIDYSVDASRAAPFYKAVRQYWPDLADDCLSPAYSGIRPKLSGPGEPAADFRLDGKERHGLDNLLVLYGIESPGLTSCLALADEVLRRCGVTPREDL